jgi:hypothetical protein
MKKILATVIITTANIPPAGMPSLAMTNAAHRRTAAKAALFFWASQGIRNIVIADATANQLLSQGELNEMSLLGTSIEQIFYSQNEQDVILKGKGYAEGELLKFTIENSRLLKNEEAFFKSTGKTYVRNFPAIYDLISKAGIGAIFWRHLEDGSSIKPWADCRFYFTSKEVAVNSLVPAYLQSDESTTGPCEYYIFQMLELNQSFVRANALRPLISGFAGETGNQYFDGSLGTLDLNAPCWVRPRPI